jgi:predicted RNase H-like nuclease (RuvC/YqgF family)
MSMTKSPRRGRRGLAVGLTVTALLLVSGSTVLAADTSTTGSADPDQPTSGQVSGEAATADLRAQLDDLSLRYDELSADNTSLQQAVDDLSAERDRLARTLSHFDDVYEPMEADRQLLFELRKELPETRPEAEAQLERIRSLALAADPAHLGQLVDRLGEAAPVFLDWRFEDHVSDTEAAQAYVDSGASAFDTTMSEFRNEVLLSVANRLDGILTVIDRLR